MQLINNDGIPYELNPTPMKGKNGQQLYYVQFSGKQTSSMRMLDDYCAQQFYMQKNEMKRALDVFMQAAAELLANGFRVNTPFGTFAPRLGLKREITNVDDVTDKDITLEGIDFRMNHEFLNEMKRWMNGFHRVEKGDTRQLMADSTHLETALRQCLHNGCVTIRTFMIQANLTYYSARKQLDEWTQGDRPKLQKAKMGQQIIYTEV